MDKRKIGQFIAECRRNKHITQEQLAEKLNVTHKSVSKWENGYCLPDASLYEQLCGILDISINELFEGRRSDNQDCKSAADKSLMQMIKYRLYLLRDKRLTFSEFDRALTKTAELTEELKRFGSKEEAVQYLMNESHCPSEECAKAYDFYMNLFVIGEPEEES